MTNLYEEGESFDSLSSNIQEIDRELEELLKKQSAKIKIMGIGGGGSLPNQSLARQRKFVDRWLSSLAQSPLVSCRHGRGSVQSRLT